MKTCTENGLSAANDDTRVKDTTPSDSPTEFEVVLPNNRSTPKITGKLTSKYLRFIVMKKSYLVFHHQK